MKIAGIQKVSLIDYPDKIAATIFLAGCNLNCGYCHNRWLANAETTPEALGSDAFFAWLETRKGLLDGVCVTGGEPTLSPDLPEILRRIRGMGFRVKLDTNGTNPSRLRAVLREGLVDHVALDLKAPLDDRYTDVTGKPVEPATLMETLEVLRAWGGTYELRTTVGPQVSEAWLRDIAYSLLPVETWYLQVFRAVPGVNPDLLVAPAPDENALRAIAERLRPLAPGVRVRGL